MRHMQPVLAVAHQLVTAPPAASVARQTAPQGLHARQTAHVPPAGRRVAHMPQPAVVVMRMPLTSKASCMRECSTYHSCSAGEWLRVWSRRDVCGVVVILLQACSGPLPRHTCRQRPQLFPKGSTHVCHTCRLLQGLWAGVRSHDPARPRHPGDRLRAATPDVSHHQVRLSHPCTCNSSTRYHDLTPMYDSRQ